MKWFIWLILSFVFLFFVSVSAQSSPQVVINEIAWMGTIASSNDEWIELFNPTLEDIDLTNWTLIAADGSPSIVLNGIIPAQGLYLLERTNDSVISDIPADQIYTGSLSNSGEHLILRDSESTIQDEVPLWYAGDNSSKASMERVTPMQAANENSNWISNNGSTFNGLDSAGNSILGTPKQVNSASVTIEIPTENPIVSTQSGTKLPELPENDITDSQIILNEFSIHNPNGQDWVELVCLDCPASGLDLSGFEINNEPVETSTLIFSDEYLVISLDLPDESGEIIVRDTNKTSIIHHSYGVGQELDYQERLAVIAENQCSSDDSVAWSIGRQANGSGSQLHPISSDFEIFPVETPGSVNLIHEHSPLAIIQAIKVLYSQNDEQADLDITLDGSKSCDADGDALDIEWYINDQVYLDTTQLNYNFSGSGQNTVSLTVTDSQLNSHTLVQDFLYPPLEDIKISINEINYDEDWIELYCQECGPNGLYLDNLKLLKNTSTSTFLSFPSNEIFHTGDYILIHLRQSEEQVRPWELRANGSRLFTIYSKKTGLGPSGSLHIGLTGRPAILASLNWIKKPDTSFVSFGQNDSGGTEWTTTATPGTANQFVQASSTPNSTETNQKSGSEPASAAPSGPIINNAEIVINEIFVNPKGPDGEKEFIELRNFENRDINLSGWKLDDILDGGSNAYAFPDNTIIKSQGYKTFYQSESKIVLNNDTDAVHLIKPDGQIQSKVQYTEAKEDYGYSRNKEGDFVWDKILTPGSPNEFPVLQKIQIDAAIIIDAILPNPVGADTGQEYVSLFNPGQVDLNLRNWVIDNKDGGSAAYSFGDLIIKAGQSLVLSQNLTSLQFTNTSDQVRILDPEQILIDSFSWQNAPEGKIYHRDQDGEYDLGIVVNVVDGDTVDIEFENGQKKRIRLIGIDTPESVHPKKEVERFGIEASEYTNNKLLHKNIRLRYDLEILDKYQRTLAYIYLEDGTLFNKRIIQDGYAFVYTQFPFRHLEDFVQYETEAKAQKRGMWADETLSEEIKKISLEEDEIIVEDITDESIGEKSNALSGTVLIYNPEDYKDLILSEIYPAPRSEEEEFIELYNQSEHDIDLSHCYLDDILDGGSKSFMIPSGTIIRANDYISFSQSETKLSLNNSGDAVHLLTPGKEILDSALFEKTQKGHSYSRNLSDKSWYWTEELSMNNSNPPPLVTNSISEAEQITAISKATRMHKYQIFKTKGLVLKGRTLPNLTVIIQVDEGQKIVTNSDDKGYFEIQYLQALESGEHQIHLEIISKDGLHWEKRAIQILKLETNYSPPMPTPAKTAQKKSSSSKNSYKYVNIVAENMEIEASILALFSSEEALLLQNNEEELILASFSDFNLPQGSISEYFTTQDRIKMRGKWNNNIFYIEQYQKIEPDPVNSTHNIASNKKHHWVWYELLGVALAIIAFTGYGAWLKWQKIKDPIHLEF